MSAHFESKGHSRAPGPVYTRPAENGATTLSASRPARVTATVPATSLAEDGATTTSVQVDLVAVAVWRPATEASVGNVSL